MKLSLFIFMQLIFVIAYGQQLKPGFNKAEYAELMRVSARTVADSAYATTIPAPERFKMLYQSPVLGIDNLWDLWTDNKGTAVISIRGTTKNAVSWLGNFYAAMVPARGELQINKDEVFKYELADNPKAAVHIGWLISTAFLSKDMLPKIDSLYKNGTKEILIMGHSQGGAIAFLVTAYLYQLQKKNLLPQSIRFKTYCSAGPKPGNVFFAYDYEAMTQNGWAYNVVNSADWVPQTPFSIQTLDDFNTTNPFHDARSVIKKQGFPKNIVLKHLYNQLDKSIKKAEKKYRKYLGTMVARIMKKSLPGYMPPEYYKTMDYARAGNTIVLLADEAYYKLYPDNKQNVFIHHIHKPYLFLLERLQ